MPTPSPQRNRISTIPLLRKYMGGWIKSGPLRKKKNAVSRQSSKWRLFLRWRRKCLSFTHNIFKNDIFVHFSFVFL
jgi:hypothetical protein